MGKSFANGNGASVANGASMANGNGPVRTLCLQGWDIRPCTSWVLTIGQDPA